MNSERFWSALSILSIVIGAAQLLLAWRLLR